MLMTRRKARQNNQACPDRKYANPREELFMFLQRDDPEELGQAALCTLSSPPWLLNCVSDSSFLLRAHSRCSGVFVEGMS